MADNYAARAALEKWLHDTEIQERTYFTGFDRGIRVCVIVIGWLRFCARRALEAVGETATAEEFEAAFDAEMDPEDTNPFMPAEEEYYLLREGH